MTRTFVEGLLFAVALYGAAFGGVLVAHASATPAVPAEPCDPAYTAQCCACPPSDMAEPAPLPHLYLPAVANMPRMTSEYTPAPVVVTPEPDPPVTGDVQ